MRFSVFGFTVEPWMFAAVLGGIAAWEAVRLWLGLASAAWPVAEGQVLRARIESRTDRDDEGVSHDRFVPIVRYRYWVAGRDYEATRLSFRSLWAYDYEGIATELAGVVTGQSCRVHHHPRFPALAVLRPGVSRWSYVIVGGLVVGAVLVVWTQ